MGLNFGHPLLELFLGFPVDFRCILTHLRRAFWLMTAVEVDTVKHILCMCGGFLLILLYRSFFFNLISFKDSQAIRAFGIVEVTVKVELRRAFTKLNDVKVGANVVRNVWQILHLRRHVLYLWFFIFLSAQHIDLDWLGMRNSWFRFSGRYAPLFRLGEIIVRL